jgi:hypothetical protein
MECFDISDLHFGSKNVLKKKGDRDICFHQDTGIHVGFSCVVLTWFGFSHAVKVNAVLVKRKQ